MKRNFFKAALALTLTAIVPTQAWAVPFAGDRANDRQPEVAIQFDAQGNVQDPPRAEGAFFNVNNNIAIIGGGINIIIETVPISLRRAPYELNEQQFQEMLSLKRVESKVLDNGLIEIIQRHIPGHEIQSIRLYQKYSYLDANQVVNFYVCTKYAHYSNGQNTHTEFISGPGMRDEYYGLDGRINEIFHTNVLDSTKNYHEVYQYNKKDRLNSILIYEDWQKKPTMRKFFRWDGVSAPTMTVQRYVRLRGLAMEWQDVRAVSVTNIQEEVKHNNVKISFQVDSLQKGQQAVLEYRERDATNWMAANVSQTATGYQGSVPTTGFEKEYEYRIRVIDVIHLNQNGQVTEYTLAEQQGVFVTQSLPSVVVDAVSGVGFGLNTVISWQFENAMPGQITQFFFRRKGQDAIWNYIGNTDMQAHISGNLGSNVEYEYRVEILMQSHIVSVHYGEFKTKPALEAAVHQIAEQFETDPAQPYGTISGAPVEVIKKDPDLSGWRGEIATINLTNPDGSNGGHVPSSTLAISMQNQTFAPGSTPSFTMVVSNRAPAGTYRGTVNLFAYSGAVISVVDTISFEIIVQPKTYAGDITLSADSFIGTFERNANGFPFVSVDEITIAPVSPDVSRIRLNDPGIVRHIAADGTVTEFSGRLLFRASGFANNGQAGTFSLLAREFIQPGTYRGEIEVVIDKGSLSLVAQKIPFEFTVTGAASPEFEFPTVSLVRNINLQSYGWSGRDMRYQNYSLPVQGVAYNSNPNLIRVSPDGNVSKYYGLGIGITSSNGSANYGYDSQVPLQVAAGTPAGIYFGTGAVSFQNHVGVVYHAQNLDYQFGVSAGGVTVTAGVLPAFKMQAEEIILPEGQTLEVNGVLDIPAGGVLKLGTVEIHGPFHVEGKIKIAKDLVEIDANAVVQMDGGSISVGGVQRDIPSGGQLVIDHDIVLVANANL